ncbi:MAG: TonB-dependent receptor plug domain-containing protein [Roseibacillus sp.]
MNQKKTALHSALLLACPSISLGQDLFESVTLPETVVIANRLEEPAHKVAPAFTQLATEDLERKGIYRLEDALRQVPGVQVASEGGQRGSISALRLRGTESDHTLFLVDGLRVTDSNNAPSNLLGADSLAGGGQLGILRGPQSALYGSAAIGGVVSQETGRGEEVESNSWFLEAGSFGSVRSGLRIGGETDGLRYFVGLGGERTENDRPNNNFQQTQSAIRLETDLNDQTVVGTTLRYGWSEYQNPSGNSYATDERESILGSIYLERAQSDIWDWSLTLGFYRDEFEERGPFPFGSSSNKASLEWRNELEWSEQHRTAAGLLTEWQDYETGGVDESVWLGAAYINHLWEPTEGLVFGLGGRGEWFEAWEEVFTWRGTATYTIPDSGLRVHGSYGTGFRAPSFFELYGSIPAFFFEGNPDLEPERSRGWDAGVEWTLGESFLVDLTYFQNDIKNLIDFSPSNVGQAKLKGLEGNLRGSWFEQKVELVAALTYLFEAEDKTTGQRLVRRPEWTASADLALHPNERFTIGFGASYNSERIDLDFASFPAGRVSIDSSILARAYASYDLTDAVTLTGRIENAFNEDYQEVLGVPTRGFGAFGGIRMEF